MHSWQSNFNTTGTAGKATSEFCSTHKADTVESSSKVPESPVCSRRAGIRKRNSALCTDVTSRRCSGKLTNPTACSISRHEKLDLESSVRFGSPCLGGQLGAAEGHLLGPCSKSTGLILPARGESRTHL